MAVMRQHLTMRKVKHAISDMHFDIGPRSHNIREVDAGSPTTRILETYRAYILTALKQTRRCRHQLVIDPGQLSVMIHMLGASCRGNIISQVHCRIGQKKIWTLRSDTAVLYGIFQCINNVRP